MALLDERLTINEDRVRRIDDKLDRQQQQQQPLIATHTGGGAQPTSMHAWAAPAGSYLSST
eukprot:scaffold126171_cov18-Tisochrysis_lutea.AAC.1